MFTGTTNVVTLERVFDRGTGFPTDGLSCARSAYDLSVTYFVGTSGYNYPEWRGTFYPEKFSTAKMLAFYAERFRTVEINYTFYRMPNEKLLDGWAQGTPDGFTFTLKAPRRITHDAKLQRCEDLTQIVLPDRRDARPKLATLLFQLPPTFKKDARCCASFLELAARRHTRGIRVPARVLARRDVFDMLRARNLALCIADSEKMSTPVETTADYAYFRLRDEGYQQPTSSAGRP